ncbi:hypothetical protein HRG_014186 [Hirsutella rhossiliensis]
MMDKFQCQTHTRSPWGRRDHRYDYRLRYLIMGILLVSFLAVVTVGVVFTFAGRKDINSGSEPEAERMSADDSNPVTTILVDHAWQMRNGRAGQRSHVS